MSSIQLSLANPRGFCAGVDRAIEIVNRALDLFGAPVYVRHEVVHNKAVVNSLKERGAVFIQEVDQAPDNAVLIFSAHGVSLQVRKQAEQRKLKIFDATCPLVTKVHLEVARYSRDNIPCVLIGHKGHPEVEGTLGQYDKNSEANIYLVENIADVASLPITANSPIAYVSQTTLSMDDTQQVIQALIGRFPQIKGPVKNDICYATQSRQDAVKVLAKTATTIFVVGSKNSSNSNRLKEVAEKQGATAYLIDNASEINQTMITNVSHFGLTAGASAPEYLVEEVKLKLLNMGVKLINEDFDKAENVVFAIPEALK